MNKLALAVSISVISGSAMATVPQTEVDFNGYDVETFARPDNQSVILQSNNTTSSVVIQQGSKGDYDANISVVDMRLQGWGKRNKVYVNQEGGDGFFPSAQDSLVRIAGTSGGARITVDQNGKYNDSQVVLSGDADNNTVDVTQTNGNFAEGNWSDVAISGSSDFNKIDIDQNGSGNISEVSISGGSSGSSAGSQKVKVNQKGSDSESYVNLYNASVDNDVNVDQDNDGHYSNISVNGNLNDIDVKQSGSASDTSDIYLFGESDSNIVNVTQSGDNFSNRSEITLYASSGNGVGAANHVNSVEGIRVIQTGGDISTIVMNNSTNSAIYVNQQ
ncbi:hypothetical protein L1D61_18280 [Vibrio mediterranei]|nr:hypothetical protein [Vibrio mediterranei]